jgi:hypothetical protein
MNAEDADFQESVWGFSVARKERSIGLKLVSGLLVP